jgi:chitodextrinase
MNRKNKNIRKFLSSCIIVSMVITAFATMITIHAPSMKAVETDGSEPSLRIYGEQDAVYPTQSYYGENDFIYPEEYDPFDPGIIEKDSITFNSAFWFGHDEYEIEARGDASEKIFLRAFYEPGYTHPIDAKMDDCSDVLLQPVEQFDGIVTETTYFLVTLYDRQPNYGFPGETRFAFPYVSTDPDNPGMEEADLLELAYASNAQTKQFTDGEIEVEKEYQFDNIDYTQDITIRFMDHKVTIVNFEDNDPNDDKLDIAVSYVGNMYDAIPSTSSHTIWENSFGPDPSNNYYFDRFNHKQTLPDACHRWYLRIENADSDYLRITIGRRLVAGETFYVDGVRYDMPAIYVNNIEDDGNDNGHYGFKYITLQSPIPKGSPIWETDLSDNVDDFSHVTSQYLASLPDSTTAWLLPPFNGQHVMIDDIGLQKSYPHMLYNCLPTAGVILDGKKDALEFYYIAEDIEERFESSLMERLNTDETEEWYWYNVYTLPNRYTEFILPNQETTEDYYDDDIYGYTSKADGNEYLITSSLIAPNSHVDTDRSDSCKDYDEHEIFDRVNEIALAGERGDYYKMPRFVFEFDASNHIDFFINEGTMEPSVRIYGEENFYYPTQSYTGPDDFVYDLEEDPFDPGIIKKDSITFNPAFIDGHGGVYEIQAQGDASEKIFLRAFYEPGYTHPVDTLMDDCSDVILKPVEQFDAIVTETTYFLVTLDEREPTFGYPWPDITQVVLPYTSCDEDIPGMEVADLLDVRDTSRMTTTQLTDGSVTVEKVFEFLDDSYIGTPIQFMDHKVTVVNFENNDPTEDLLDLRVSYAGNMYDAISSTRTYSIAEDLWGKDQLWFNRNNKYEFNDDACHRWYLRIENADDNYLRIVLGRKLVAGETFYVDGMRYDIPAVYVNNIEDGEGHYGFKYITLQSPIPKGSPVWQLPLSDNVDDFSHVSSQYLASLPDNTPVWLLPPFNEDHIMIDDIGLQKLNPHSGSNCLPARGIMLDEEKEPLEFFYIEEDVEERFESSLMERLNTEISDYDIEEWYWYNVYTLPNRYTEFVLPDQETTEDYYDPDDLFGYPYSKADGNEYLITSSLVAPNSELDTDRSDSCKDYDEHEIFSRRFIGNNGASHGFAQLAMLIDASGSIGSTDFTTMVEGIAAAVEDGTVFPHDGSVELTIVKFSNSANLEVNSPVIVDQSNYQTIANAIRTISYVGGGTAMSSAFSLATTTLFNSPNFDPNDRQVVNIVTDGEPNSQSATITARNTMITTLGMDVDPKDEIDAEAIGFYANPEWLRANIVWPQPGIIAPPYTPGYGWVRVVTDFEEFSETIGEKFELIFYKYDPRFTFEFDACDGTGLYINGVDSMMPPTADVDCGKEGYSGECEIPVMFDGSCSYDNDEGGDYIVQYDWDFGDGSTGTGPTPTHTYMSAGTYTVTLIVTDDEGQTDTDKTNAEISCGSGQEEDPIADPNGPYCGGVEEQIQFDGTESYDPDGGSIEYDWDFGDGNTGTGPTPTHTYMSAGTYTVTLHVTDDEGATDTAQTTASIPCGGQIYIDDVYVECEGVYYTYLHATNIAGHVTSCKVTLSWDPEKFDVDKASIDSSEFDNPNFPPYVDSEEGELTILSWMSQGSYLTGDFIIAKIGFYRVGNGDSDLIIEYSELLNDDDPPEEIPHTTINGRIYNTCANSNPPGDMNGDGKLNSADVRYLAIYIASGGKEGSLHDDPDVNCDGKVNSADVRYLAIYIASGGKEPGPLYPC